VKVSRFTPNGNTVLDAALSMTEKEVVDAELKMPTKKVRARGSVKQELPQHAGAIEDGGVEMEVLEREECRCSDGAVRTQCPT